MKKCVHVLGFDDYLPEMCAYTLPNMQRFADRIKADFKRIRTRKFPDYPINYERLQIFKNGLGYDWNIVLDADILIHPDFPDPTTVLGEEYLTTEGTYPASQEFHVEQDPYFTKDKRNLGLNDGIVITTHRTHGLWEPLAGDFSKWSRVCKNNPRLISEYCLSFNLARKHLKYANSVITPNNYFHMNATSKRVQDPVRLIAAQMKAWGLKL